MYPVAIVLVVAAACARSGGGDNGVDAVNGCLLRPRAACHGKQLVGASLGGADLTGADLSGADLEGAGLQGTVLAHANLADATLAHADLSRADLTGANLSNADLEGAILVGAKLDGASLTGAKQCAMIGTNGGRVDTGCSSGGGLLFPVAPPVLEQFGVANPPRCARTPSGTTLEVSWSYKNVTTASFSVDGVTVYQNFTGRPEQGSVAIPFPCDGKAHALSIVVRAIGSPVPPQVKTITVTAT